MLTTYQQHAKAKLVTTIVAVFVIAGVVVFADHLKATTGNDTHVTHTASTAVPVTTTATSPTSAATTTPSSGSAASATSTNNSGYSDGTYTATSSYYVPHGDESIQVSLTLQSGVITTASIKNSEGDPDSASYQEDFASVYKSYVVGKKINSLHLNVIAGASDTTQGFSDAASQIASKAKA